MPPSNIIAIDPGTYESAVVEFRDGKVIHNAAIWPNELLLARLSDATPDSGDTLCIEMVACYGLAVGKETFETVLWIGRFMQQWQVSTGWEARLVYRQKVKLFLCNSAKAKDGNIRQALIDRYGPVGNKKNKGLLYGIKSHLWSALAIAVYVHHQDMHSMPEGTANRPVLLEGAWNKTNDSVPHMSPSKLP